MRGAEHTWVSYNRSQKNPFYDAVVLYVTNHGRESNICVGYCTQLSPSLALDVADSRNVCFTRRIDWSTRIPVVFLIRLYLTISRSDSWRGQPFSQERAVRCVRSRYRAHTRALHTTADKQASSEYLVSACCVPLFSKVIQFSSVRAITGSSSPQNIPTCWIVLVVSSVTRGFCCVRELFNETLPVCKPNKRKVLDYPCTQREVRAI